MHDSPSATRYRYHFVTPEAKARLNQVAVLAAILMAVFGFGLIVMLSMP